MLTSTKNPRIQHIRKLQNSARVRRKEAAFVIEGVRLVEEALTAGWQPDMVIFTDDINERAQKAIDRFRESGIDTLLVSSQVMLAASETQTPQGILALLPILDLKFPENVTFLLLLDGVRDPGNLGTLLRTASAAGVDGAILTPGTVDAYSPKVVRSGMGAHFYLPIMNMNWEAIATHLKGLDVFLADSQGGRPYFETGFKDPLALIIGSEAQGTHKQASRLATHRVHIPMTGKSESLNAAIAGAILMFEVVRQRG